MKRSILFFALSFFALPSFAFILVSPSYRLAKPEDTVVNLASGGCQANGISNGELQSAIEEALDKYWNTVTESRLKISVGGEVSRSLGSTPESGEILIGCQALGTNGPSGYATPFESTGAATVVLNGTTLVPGGYTRDGLILVIAHELGHAIGLNHSNDSASIMTYNSNGWSPRARFLSQDDKDGVVFLYPRKGYIGGFLGGCGAIASPTSGGGGFVGWLPELALWAMLLGFFAIRTRRRARGPNAGR